MGALQANWSSLQPLCLKYRESKMNYCCLPNSVCRWRNEMLIFRAFFLIIYVCQIGEYNQFHVLEAYWCSYYLSLVHLLHQWQSYTHLTFSNVFYECIFLEISQLILIKLAVALLSSSISQLFGFSWFDFNRKFGGDKTQTITKLDCSTGFERQWHSN